MNTTAGRGLTISLIFGPWARPRVGRDGFAWRLCLCFVAIVIIPIDVEVWLRDVLAMRWVHPQTADEIADVLEVVAKNATRIGNYNKAERFRNYAASLTNKEN